MNLQMGSQVFRDVGIPLLWGTRAIIQDKQNRISVIDLSGTTAKLEIIGDHPAPNMEFSPIVGGFQILRDGHPLYAYSVEDKTLSAIELNLPDCQITPQDIRIGKNVFSGNVISGFGVGIAVTENGVAMGAPFPEKLAKLTF